MLILPVTIQGQTSTVSATVHDPAGQLYANGTCTIMFVPTPGRNGPFTGNGQTFGAGTTVPCTLDGTGTFSSTVVRNDFINPAGSSWTFTVCPNASSGCTSTTTQIQAASVSLSTVINAAITTNIQIFANSTNAHAYSDSEVVPIAGVGSSYFNVVDNNLHYFNGVSWVIIQSSSLTPTFTSVIVTAGETVGGTLQANTLTLTNPLSTANGGTGVNSTATFPTSGVVETGTGTTNTVSKFTNGAAGVQGNSTITDDGTTVTIPISVLGTTNSVRWVDGTKFVTCNAALADLGVNPGIVIIPSSYAGADCTTTSVRGLTQVIPPNNQIILDLRGPTSTTGYNISFNSRSQGAISTLSVYDQRTSPAQTSSTLIATHQLTGDLSSAGGNHEAFTAELDTVGTLTAAPIASIGVIDAEASISSNGQTIGDLIAISGRVQMDRAGTTTNVTRATGVRGVGCGSNISAGTFAECYGGRFENQTVGTTKNYSIYSVGPEIIGFQAAGSKIDSEDSTGAPQRFLGVDNTGTSFVQCVQSTAGCVLKDHSANIHASWNDTSNGVTFQTVSQASLGASPNGTEVYCSNCTVTTPGTCTNVTTAAACTCAAGGTGAFARRINGAWLCN